MNSKEKTEKIKDTKNTRADVDSLLSKTSAATRGIAVGAGVCFLLTMIPFDLLGSIPIIGLVLGWFGGLFSLIATVVVGILGGFVAGYLEATDPFTGAAFGGVAGAIGGIAGTVGSVIVPSLLLAIGTETGVVDILGFAVVSTLLDPSLWVGVVTGPFISVFTALFAGLIAGVLQE